MFDKINRRRFLVNAFKDGYPAIHDREYELFLKHIPESIRKSYYGSEDLEYIKFLQARNVQEFNVMVTTQLQGISI